MSSDANPNQKNLERVAQLRGEIMRLVREFYVVAHEPKRFVPGTTRISYAGRVFDADELEHGVESILQYWLTAGPFANSFERSMRAYFGAPAALLVNSGSSANLLMLATLCNPLVEGHLVPGDEVITPATTFPTTLTPVLQLGLLPVFVDCQPGEYNVDPTQIEAAVGPRTRAILVPHTVGIPADLDVIIEVAKRHRLWLLEDTCDALGATWHGNIFSAISYFSCFKCALVFKSCTST